VRAITCGIIESPYKRGQVRLITSKEEGKMSYQSRDRLLGASDLYTSPADRPGWRQRVAFTFALWRQRREMRRALMQMDARSLRDAGISPAAAAYESGKAFWEKMGDLR
jgi:uncharacterized protein YjiS (DUF1127 family)